MKQIHNITERLGEWFCERRNRMGIAEWTAHGATLTALVLTFALSFATVELNPVAKWLFDTIGYPATGALAMIVVGLLFEGYRRLAGEYPRTAEAGAWAIAGVGVLDVTINLWQLATVGWPETTLMRTVWAIVLAGLLGVGSVVVVRDAERFSALAPRPSRSTVRMAIVSIVAISMVVTATAGVSTFGARDGGEYSAVGDARAAGGFVFDDFEDQDFDEWASVGSEPEITNSSLAGEHSLKLGVKGTSGGINCKNCERMNATRITSGSSLVRIEQGGQYGTTAADYRLFSGSSLVANIQLVRADQSHNFSISGEDTNVPWEIGVTYTIEYDNIDFSSNSFNVSISNSAGETIVNGNYGFINSASEFTGIRLEANDGIIKWDDIEFNNPREKTTTATAKQPRYDYDLSVCYNGQAEFKSVGAEATWNPYPTNASNSWASSEYTDDQSSTEFNRYGETTLEDANASPNVSYRVGVEGDRAAFVFDGVNPTKDNTRSQFEIASPFENWVTDPARISGSGECGPGETATPSTTPMPTPVGTPPADGDLTALGTCTLPAANGSKTGLLVEYWDPSMSTENIWFNLSYAGTSINEFVEFDSPKGYYFGCHGADEGGITPPDGGAPTPYPEPTAFPNGTQPTPYPQPTAYPQPEPPTLNGSANTTDGSSLNFSEIGFGDTDPANSLNGDLSGGFGPTGGGSGGSPVVGIALVSVVGYGALRLTGNDKRVAKAAQKAVGRLR